MVTSNDKSAATDPAKLQSSLVLVLTTLRELADPAYRQGLTRFAIQIDRALGVSMVKLKLLAKPLRGRHDLAFALWEGIYEARLMAALIDDPKQVSAQQMDRWAADFDNWGELRHGLLCAVRSHAACLAKGRRVG